MKIKKRILPNDRENLLFTFTSEGSVGINNHKIRYMPLRPPVNKKINRTKKEFIPKNFAIPPHTPPIQRLDFDL